MRRISSKLFAINLIFACVSVFLTLYISYQAVNNISLENASSLGTAYAEIDAKEIDNWLKAKTTLLESIAVQIENEEAYDEVRIQKILKNAAETDPSFYSFFIGFENGKLMDANGWVPPSDYSTVDRPWYREAAAANRIIFSSAYIDKKKNTWVKAIAMPLHVQGRNAVLAANIPFDAIRKQIQGIRFGQTGYGILVDGAGIILVHPQKSNEMKSLDAIQAELGIRLQESSWKNQKGTIITGLGSQAKLLVQVPIQSNDWRLLLIAPIEEFRGPAREMAGQLMTKLSLLLGLTIVIIYLLGRKISEPVYTVRNIQKDSLLLVDNARKLIQSIESNGSFVRAADEEGHKPSEGNMEGIIVGHGNSEASLKKEKHIAGTEEVYAIAGQIDQIAAHLEKGVQAFKI